MLFGVVFLSHQLGSFAGLWLAGYLYDATKSYDTMWWISIALGLFAALIHWPIQERPVARLAAESGVRTMQTQERARRHGGGAAADAGRRAPRAARGAGASARQALYLVAVRGEALLLDLSAVCSSVGRL